MRTPEASSSAQWLAVGQRHGGGTVPAQRLLAALTGALLVAGLFFADAVHAADYALSRNPYLSDVSATSVRVNWATAGTANGVANVVTWGPDGGGCNQYSRVATSSSFTVMTTAETMWSARLGNLAPSTAYCYQILASATPVLAAALHFRTLPAPGDTRPFSFDVIGDTGYNGGDGTNADQDRLYSEMAGSGASFILTTGDMAYPNGSQNNYGDLIQTGADVSNVFGPNGWSVPGGSTPTFAVLGNHGRSATFLQNWPAADAVDESGGTYAMLTYPGQSGANAASYPTAYYAFSVGQARFYVLDADWTDSNVGTSTLYGQDYLNHWAPGDAEYQWLKSDLAAHPGGLKFATFHFPLHSDNATESSDTYLQGAGALEGLLASSGVDIAFNGHAHMYERNAAAIGSMVSYVTGGGGAVLEPTAGRGCTAIDLYSIGWSPTNNSGSHCGAATAPSSASQVYHFLHVTVSGSSVTVSPENALGQTFDVVTYQFPSSPAYATQALPAVADTYVCQGAPSVSYGAANPLLASATSYRALLRFDTSGVDPSARVTGVTLRLYSTVALSGGGVQVHPSTAGWDEATTTWSNQPPWDTTTLATSSTPATAGWLDIALPTSSITPAGTANFGLDYSIAQTIERLSGRTDPGYPPQLLVTTAPAIVTTMTSTADTYVYQGSPAATNGSVTPLLVSAAAYRGLLRFDTRQLPAGTTISGATLRVYATVGLSSGGVQVHQEADSWSETGTSWSNQPAWNSQVLATGATQSSAGWISIALPPSAITPGAVTDFGLDYAVPQMVERLASREDPAHPPQLVVTSS